MNSGSILTSFCGNLSLTACKIDIIVAVAAAVGCPLLIGLGLMGSKYWIMEL